MYRVKSFKLFECFRLRGFSNYTDRIRDLITTDRQIH